MAYLDDAKKSIVSDEGIRLKVYYDTRDIPTIGVGRNLRDDGISQVEAMDMLSSDIADRASFLAKYVWFNSLSDNRKCALVNMCFATGTGGFAKFVDMLKALAAGDFNTAAYQMINSEAAKEEPERFARLATLMREG